MKIPITLQWQWTKSFQTQLQCNINLPLCNQEVWKIIINYNMVHIRVLKLLPVLYVAWCHDYTQWAMDMHNLSAEGLDKKCQWHYKESYGLLGVKIRKKHHTVAHCRDQYKHAIQMTAKSWKRACQYKGKENRCLSNLQLNGVRLQIVHSPFHPISRFVIV